MLPEGWTASTADYTVKLLEPAIGERLVIRGRIVRFGRTLSVAAADVFAVNGGGFARFLKMFGKEGGEFNGWFAAIFGDAGFCFELSGKEVDFASLERFEKEIQAALVECFFFDAFGDPEADVVESGQSALGASFGQAGSKIDGLFELERRSQAGGSRLRSGFGWSCGGQLNDVFANGELVSRLQDGFLARDPVDEDAIAAVEIAQGYGARTADDFGVFARDGRAGQRNLIAGVASESGDAFGKGNGLDPLAGFINDGDPVAGRRLHAGGI